MIRTTACPDWERRIAAGETLIPQGPLFPQEAKAAMAVFDTLREIGRASCRERVCQYV